MLRLAEVFLFIAPFAAFALWRATLASGLELSRLQYSILLGGLAAMGAGLVYFGVHERLPAGERYVPAQVENGQIVPGHGE